MNQISGSGHCIQIAGLRRIVHALAIELKGGGEVGQEGEHPRDKVRGEGRLLSLLHVLIVGQRQAFELKRDGLRRAVDAADLGADQLGKIGILLLRHGA